MLSSVIIIYLFMIPLFQLESAYSELEQERSKVSHLKLELAKHQVCM